MNSPLTDSPKDHDFNWAKALKNCSIECEFALLQLGSQDAVNEANKDRERKVAEFGAGNGHTFFVTTLGRPPICVFFRMENSKFIQVKSDGLEELFRVSLTLNESGLCRYQIDGKGEYLRWQILKKALKPILFPA